MRRDSFGIEPKAISHCEFDRDTTIMFPSGGRDRSVVVHIPSSLTWIIRTDHGGGRLRDTLGSVIVPRKPEPVCTFPNRSSSCNFSSGGAWLAAYIQVGATGVTDNILRPWLAVTPAIPRPVAQLARSARDPEICTGDCPVSPMDSSGRSLTTISSLSVPREAPVMPLERRAANLHSTTCFTFVHDSPFCRSSPTRAAAIDVTGNIAYYAIRAKYTVPRRGVT